MNDLQRAVSAAMNAIRTGVMSLDEARLLDSLAPEQLRIAWSTVAVVDCGGFSLRVSEEWP